MPEPIIGPKAYVRSWQRLRAGVLLGAIVVGLGIGLATVTALLVVVAGFLLEQAIS